MDADTCYDEDDEVVCVQWKCAKQLRDKKLSLFILGTLVVWRSGSALVSINAVARRRARLVLGWVTVHGFESLSHRLGI